MVVAPPARRGHLRPVAPRAARVGVLAARVLGSLVGDVVLARDEIAGLSQDRSPRPAAARV